jgi:hypothetical protein
MEEKEGCVDKVLVGINLNYSSRRSHHTSQRSCN